MFLGAGIVGNRVIGSTDERQMPTPIDAKTLSFDADAGIRVRPEHVHVALRELAGVADHSFAKRFPFKVKEQEKLAGFWGP